MNDSLKSITINAISWSFIETVVFRGMQFVVGILLARMLFPDQFGLIGMLSIFFAIAQAFLLSGFSSALIQKRDVSQIDMCSIFYFNIVVGILAAGFLCIIAPWIAKFYKQPILTPMTRVLSITLVVNSLGVVQNTILIRKINFKLLTKVTVLCSFLSGIIGISLAANGFGVWSLVVQQISSSLFRTMSLWYINIWRPALVFSYNALRDMFGFGSKLLYSNLINQFFENIYFIFIGKLYSASDLGYFTRAKSLQELPSNTVSEMVGRVTFPVFSTIQDDPVRVKNGFKTVLTGMVLMIFPLMVGLAVISRPLVNILLTEKWAQSIPYIQLMCVVGLFYPLQFINVDVLTALGRSDIILRIEIIKKILVVINIIVTWTYGIIALIYGMIAVEIISYYINCYYIKILINYSISEQISDFMPYLIISLIMGAIVYIVGLMPVGRNNMILLFQVFIGGVIYISLCWLFKLRVFMEILSYKFRNV